MEAGEGDGLAIANERVLCRLVAWYLEGPEVAPHTAQIREIGGPDAKPQQMHAHQSCEMTHTRAATRRAPRAGGAQSLQKIR